MIAMKEASIAIEKANIKLYESKNFFSKLFHSKKPKKSLLAIEKLNGEVESLKQYIETWNNLDVKFQ